MHRGVSHLRVAFNSLLTCQNCGRPLQADRVSLIGSRIFHRRLPLSASRPHLLLTRDEVPLFPVGRFPGRLLLISRPSHETKYRDEICQLAESSALGCDTETWPAAFPRAPCLLQLSSRDLCIIWRLRRGDVKRDGFPPMLQGILQSPEITKVGHNLHGDAIQILQHFDVNSRIIADTEPMARKLMLTISSLCGLSAMFMGWRVSKSLTRSNWGRGRLSRAQLMYAATDAWASLEVYRALTQYAAREDVQLESPVDSTWNLLRTPHRESKSSENAVQESRMRPDRSPHPSSILTRDDRTDIPIPSAIGPQNTDVYELLSQTSVVHGS